MKHIETAHKFKYKRRMWKVVIYEHGTVVYATEPDETDVCQYQWQFKNIKKTPVVAQRLIRICQNTF